MRVSRGQFRCAVKKMLAESQCEFGFVNQKDQPANKERIFLLFACICVIRGLIFLVDESKFALRFSEHFFDGASELAATDAHLRPRKRTNRKDLRLSFALPWH